MDAITASGAACAVTASILHDIRSENCNLAIWERPIPHDFTALLRGCPQDLRFTTTLAALPEKLAAELRFNRYPGFDLHSDFIADVAMLAQHFCTALSLARFELRLEVVTTDSCRKFHADYVRARLITTYVGPGTEWLDNADAARVARSGAHGGAHGGEPAHINRMTTGDVGIFKGKLATQMPAIHRSPPISASAGKRLLLVLNPIEKAM